MNKRKGIHFLDIIMYSICLYMFCTFQPVSSIPNVTFRAFLADEGRKVSLPDDTIGLANADTIRTGDIVYFTCLVIDDGKRILNQMWDFGDGTADANLFTSHNYLKGGYYQAIASINDQEGTILADTVDIAVNTPPDSVVLDNFTNQFGLAPLNTLLSWKSYDRDEFDTVLFCKPIFVNNLTMTEDTTFPWSTKCTAVFPASIGYRETFSLFILAKDRFGEIVSSDTIPFTTEPSPETSQPTIIHQPSSATVCKGEQVSFSVVVSGEPGFVYQWFRNGNSIPDASDSIIMLPPVDFSDNGSSFSCKITNDYGETSSTAAILSITTPSTRPAGIFAEPAGICEGGSTKLSVTGGELGIGARWEWYADSTTGNSAGRGSSIEVAPRTTTRFYVRAEGLCNITPFDSVTVKVDKRSATPLDIVATPSVICIGDSSILEVRGGSLGTNATWEWYSGACEGGRFYGSGASIVVSPQKTTVYSVRAKGDCNNSDWVCCTLTVHSPSVAPAGAEADKTTICEGDSAHLFVSGGSLGTGATWRWYADSCTGSPIATGDSIVILPKKTTAFIVRAEGGCNITESVKVIVSANQVSRIPDSIIVETPVICKGSTTKLTVAGGKLGTGAEWRWFEKKEGIEVEIGTGTTIEVSPKSETIYSVIAQGDCNSTNPISATVFVETFSTTPDSIKVEDDTICENSSSQLSIAGGTLGTGAKWRWYATEGYTTRLIDSLPTITIFPQHTTRYSVRAEGKCNNTEFSPSVTVYVDSLSIAPNKIIAPDATCPNSSTQLTVSGGKLGTGSQWVWRRDSCNGDSNIIGTGETVWAPPQTRETSYFVRAEGKCNVTECVKVAVGMKDISIAPDIPALRIDTICSGQSITLSINSENGHLGTNAQWYWYSDTAGTGKKVGVGKLIQDSPKTSTEYFVRAEGDCGVCNWRSYRKVVVGIKKIVVNSIPRAMDSAICRNSSTKLYIDRKEEIPGLIPIWKWYTDTLNEKLIDSGDTIIVTQQTATTYFVRAENNCELSQWLKVKVDALKIEPPRLDTIICRQDNGRYQYTRCRISVFPGAQIFYKCNKIKDTDCTDDWIQYSREIIINHDHDAGCPNNNDLKAYAVINGCSSDTVVLIVKSK